VHIHYPSAYPLRHGEHRADNGFRRAPRVMLYRTALQTLTPTPRTSVYNIIYIITYIIIDANRTRFRRPVTHFPFVRFFFSFLFSGLHSVTFVAFFTCSIYTTLYARVYNIAANGNNGRGDNNIMYLYRLYVYTYQIIWFTLLLTSSQNQNRQSSRWRL
jgi:hypothetical protein